MLISFEEMNDCHEFTVDHTLIAKIVKERVCNHDYWVIHPQEGFSFRTVDKMSHLTIKGAFDICWNEWVNYVD
jgi:hypothetical protein